MNVFNYKKFNNILGIITVSFKRQAHDELHTIFYFFFSFLKRENEWECHPKIH